MLKLREIIQFQTVEIKLCINSSMNGENIKQKLWIILPQDY